MKIQINNAITMVTKNIEIMEAIKDQNKDLFIQISDAKGKAFTGTLLKKDSFTELNEKALEMMHTLTETGIVDLSEWFFGVIWNDTSEGFVSSNVNDSDVRFLYNNETSITEAKIIDVESDDDKVYIYTSEKDSPLGFFDNTSEEKVKEIIDLWIKDGYAKLDEYDNFRII